MKTLKIFLLQIALILVGGNVSAETFVSTHGGYAETAELIFPTKSKGTMFGNATIALEIQKVFCDGKEVVGVVRDVASYPDVSEVETADAEMIYNQSAVDLRFYPDITTKEGLFRSCEYSIPLTAYKIVIHYRIRLPGGKKTETHTLISWLKKSGRGIASER